MLTDREIGDCVVAIEDGRVRVVEADPIIHISIELLESKDVRSLVVDGDLVTLGDIDPVTYRITERGARVVEAERVCPGRLALCGVPCGCRGLNESHYPVKVS